MCGEVKFYQENRRIEKGKKHSIFFFLEQGFITDYFVIFYRFMIYNSFLF